MGLSKINNFVRGIKQNKKIDISKWNEFEVSKLFDVELSKGDNQAQKLIEGNIPLISAGNFNNGVCKYIKKGDVESNLFQKNTLTIDMFGKSFYQDEDYYAVSHGRVNILKPKFKLNKNIGLFLVGVFNSTFTKKYSFSVMCSQSALNGETIKLPVNKYNEPDWEFMEDYIKEFLSHYQKLRELEELPKKIKNETKVNLSEWKEFSLCGNNGLFELKNSISKIHSKNILNNLGSIPYVTRTETNNGVAKYIPEQKIKINARNCLTIGMDAITIFYQERDFYTGDKIKILRNKNLNKKNSLFLIAVIKHIIKQNFHWGGKGMNFKELAKLKIKLPSKNNEPDWKFMANYIRNIDRKIEVVIK
jgi:hypothetical protein